MIHGFGFQLFVSSLFNLYILPLPSLSIVVIRLVILCMCMCVLYLALTYIIAYTHTFIFNQGHILYHYCIILMSFFSAGSSYIGSSRFSGINPPNPSPFLSRQPQAHRMHGLQTVHWQPWYGGLVGGVDKTLCGVKLGEVTWS